jgi:DNA-binding MarR family transcriptional regulator
MARLKDSGVVAWIYMMRVFDKLERLSSEDIERFDVTQAQFGVLAHLSAQEGISQQELSEKLFVTKGNVCGLIDRMEKRGLVERRFDPEDRRSNLLFLTEEGRKLARRAVPSHEQFMSEQMSALTHEEQQTLRALMRKLDKSIV